MGNTLKTITYADILRILQLFLKKYLQLLDVGVL